jgi:hypothetical protein
MWPEKSEARRQSPNAGPVPAGTFAGAASAENKKNWLGNTESGDMFILHWFYIHLNGLV